MALFGLLEWVHQNTARYVLFSWKASWRQIQKILQNFPPTDSVLGVQSMLSCPPSPARGGWLNDFSLPLCSVVKSSLILWLRGLQHTRLLCPSLSPGVCSNSCPLSRWCHPTISSSVTPFSSWLQSFPASGSLPMSWLFASGEVISK